MSNKAAASLTSTKRRQMADRTWRDRADFALDHSLQTRPTSTPLLDSTGVELSESPVAHCNDANTRSGGPPITIDLCPGDTPDLVVHLGRDPVAQNPVGPMVVVELEIGVQVLGVALWRCRRLSGTPPRTSWCA